MEETAAAGQSHHKPQKKRRGFGWLIALAILVVVFIGGFLWFKWPDFPSHPIMAVQQRISSFFSREKSMPPLDSQTMALVDSQVAQQDVALWTPQPGSVEERQANIRAQLKSTGLPIAGIYILQSPNGQPVLTVGLSYEKLADISMSAGLADGVNTLMQLINNKSLNLVGMHDVTVFIQDNQGRVLFGLSMPVSQIESYREGKITQSKLMRSIGFKGISHEGILGAIGKVVPK